MLYSKHFSFHNKLSSLRDLQQRHVRAARHKPRGSRNDKTLRESSFGRVEIKSPWKCGSIVVIVGRTTDESNVSINWFNATDHSSRTQFYNVPNHCFRCCYCCFCCSYCYCSCCCYYCVSLLFYTIVYTTTISATYFSTGQSCADFYANPVWKDLLWQNPLYKPFSCVSHGQPEASLSVTERVFVGIK